MTYWQAEPANDQSQGIYDCITRRRRAVLVADFSVVPPARADLVWRAGSGGWIHGLKLFVVAVVAQAVWQMGRTLCPDRPRIAMALLVAVSLLMIGETWMQILALAIAGAVGSVVQLGSSAASEPLQVPLQSRKPALFAVAFAVLLLVSFLPQATGSLGWIAAEMYRAGALVFGGGHVVLPWLQEGFVASGAMAADTFLAGYGVAQAMPGPLFSFSGFLGGSQAGAIGGVVAVIAVFLPGTLLVFAGLAAGAAECAGRGDPAALNSVHISRLTPAGIRVGKSAGFQPQSGRHRQKT